MGLFDGAEDPLSEVSDVLSDFGADDEAAALEDAVRIVQAAIDQAGGMPQARYRFLLGTDWGDTVPTDHVGWEDAITQAGRIADNLLEAYAGEARNYGGLGAAGINQLLGEESTHERPTHRVLGFEVEEGLSQLWSATISLALPCQAAVANVATGPGSEATNIEDRVGDALDFGGITSVSADVQEVRDLVDDVGDAIANPDPLANDLADAQDPDLIDWSKLPVDHRVDPTLPERYLGQLARFSVARRLPPLFYTLNERWFTGTVVGFEDRGGSPLGLRFVRLTIAPHLARLGLRRRYRIFRDKNAIQIVAQLLDEHGIYPADPGEAGITARRFEPGGAELFGPIGVPDALTAAVDKIAGALPFGLGEEVGDAIGGVLEQSIEAWRPKREICVQYGETDLELVERLLAEEGLTFFFEHRERRETLVICEDPRLAGTKVLTAGRLPLTVVTGPPGGNQVRNNELAWDLAVARRPVPSGVTLRDRCYARPTDPTDLEAGETPSLLSPSGVSALTTAGGLEQMANQVVGLATELVGAPGTEDYAGPEAQWFEWPARLPYPPAPDDPLAYDAFDGPPMAQLRLEGFRAEGAIVRGHSECATLTPGHHVRVHRQPFDVLHPNVQEPQRLLVTRVRHTFGGGGPGPSYENVFDAQSPTLAYRPPPPRARPRVRGVQTAIVIDVSGEVSVLRPEESAWRVKVRFPWEREEDADGEEGSGWLRFAQPYTGAGFGALFVPRVGMEVVVGFEEGDPDRPYVLGALYAAPYEAAAGARHASSHKPADHAAGRIDDLARMTEAGVSTHSWPQDEHGERARHNRLRFDDHAGKERVVVFAQHDLAEEVGRDHVTSVRREQANVVGGDQRERVGGDQTLVVRHPSAGETDFGRDVSITKSETVEVGAATSAPPEAATDAADAEASEAEGPAPGDLVETIDRADALEVGGARAVSVTGSQESLLVRGAGASEDAPGRALKIVGPSAVTIEENDELVVTGDRRVRASGAFTLTAKSIDLKTPAASPEGEEGPYEETGSLQVNEEGVALESKGDAALECEHLEASAGRVVVKAATQLRVQAGECSMLLSEAAGTISFVAPAGRALTVGNEAAFIELTKELFRVVAESNTLTAEHAGDGVTTTIAAPAGEAKLSATDEIHVNAPSIVLGEPGGG